MKTLKSFWIVLAVLPFFALTGNAQTAKLSLKESSIIVKGTSSLHDWRCKTEQFSGDISYSANALTLKDITTVNLELVVKSLRSIKENGNYYETGMDKNTYKALNADKFPKITFVLTDISNLKASAGKADFVAKGNLTIAGSQKAISFPVNATLTANGIIVKGSTTFKMTTFGITPPKALLGTIKTGDEITIVFNASFKND
ncbi:MAG: YceI family protein [Pedobacter sp.]|uniref:YceI family protein n=1 Tax=Pedobacter sp. TaxID=1411316 RepID=UPI0028069644|nr:YceI family protein [Pedobacter sp.]MDQ8004670.1 YceI family protein [Pedobacter sp.]